MSQKKNKYEPPFHGNEAKKTGKNFNEDTKLRANVISKLCANFQDSFDLALIASVAHTCQWDISRATEALLLLSGGKTNVKKNKNSKGGEKDGTKNKAKSLPGTLKQEKSRSGKRIGSGSSVHYNSTNSLSSGQVWQRHYKSKPQSPGLLTMIPHQNKEAAKQKKPQTYAIVPKPKPAKYSAAKQKVISEVKKIMQMVNNGVKVMIIMRGAPGSGKTHFAQCIVGLVTGNEMSQHILSTDDYFIMLGRGNYAYEYNQLPQAHNWNQKRVSEALKRGINPIIVDNTNIQAWEMQPYVFMAVEHDYVVKVLEPATDWKYKEAELAKRNVHSVPREKIRQMLEKYEPGWTGEKLLKSFGLKYKNSGSAVVTQEKRLPTNSLLAQHRQNSVVDAPEKPKRKKNTSKKKDRRNMAGIEITEDKEKQLEELKNLFAEYGKKMNPSTKQKVLESGVSISEVVSRMRKLQGNVLPLPNQNIPSTAPETDQSKPVFYDKTIHSVPQYSSPRKDFHRESAETDTMSSSNASETSECETDTDIDLPKWHEMKRYFETGGSGHFVDGEDLFEDYDDEDNENERGPTKDEGAVGGAISRSHISSSQEELSLIDFGTNSLPPSYSPDNLSLLDYAVMENDNRDSSSSSEEQETQMLSLQESLREVLIDNKTSDDSSRIMSNRKKELEQGNDAAPSTNILEQSTIEITDSLRETLGRRFEKPESRLEDSEEVRGGVSINESLLQMLVKKYSSEEPLEKTDNSTFNIPTKDLSLHKKSPDLEEVPLPSIPPEKKISDTSSSAGVPKTANLPYDWCGTKTDKFEDIVNSWEHPRSVEAKSDDSPKQARPKNALLGAIKKNVAQPREKSPEELLRSADLGWSSISFDSWEDVKKKPAEPEPSNYPKLQRRPVSKMDSFTNTAPSDFNLWKEEGGESLKLNARSRNINPNYNEPSIPITFKSDILMLDKSSMTVDAEELELMSRDSGLETLSGMFPDISKEYLSDVLEKCKGSILWAIEVLLETPQNLAKMPEHPPAESNPPSYNEAKAMGDADLTSLQNVVIADGKKTIKRKKEKKSSASELSLLLKKQIEESIQINEDLYEDKTLMLKKLRHGEIDFDEPLLPVPTIPDEKQPEKYEWDEEDDDDEEEMIPMKIDPEFFSLLAMQFGAPDSSSSEKQIALAPVVNIPMSLAQQIFDCWLDTMNKQLEEMQSAYDVMVKEDELLATALQQQEFEYRQPDLREIMDMELAMLLYKQDQAHLHENRETLATKLSKQLLFEAYPNMDKKMLLDLFESEGRSFENVVDVLEAQENKTPKTVIAPEFLAVHGNKLMEQAKSENLFKEKKEPSTKKTLIVLKENTLKKKTADKTNILIVNPAEYRQKIAQLQQQRNECCRLAQEAFRKKSFPVASYFSHMAGLYKDRIQEMEKDYFQSSIFEEKEKRNSTEMDLHNLTVREALQIVDMFLNHHIKLLREKNETTVCLGLITGRGKHSDQGKSKLKPAVEARLKKRDISYCEVNQGKLSVTLHRKNLLCEEMD